MDSKRAWPLHSRETLSLLYWTINKPSLWSTPGFLSLSTIDILHWTIFCCEDSRVHYKIFNRFPGHYPLDVSSTPSLIMTKNVSRNCQISPWRQITSSWEWLLQRKSLPLSFEAVHYTNILEKTVQNKGNLCLYSQNMQNTRDPWRTVSQQRP